MSAAKPVDLYKKIDFSRSMKVTIKCVKKIRIADSFLNFFGPKLINTVYVFRVNTKNLYLACSQKLTDKCSQALVG